MNSFERNASVLARVGYIDIESNPIELYQVLKKMTNSR